MSFCTKLQNPLFQWDSLKRTIVILHKITESTFSMEFIETVPLRMENLE